MKRSFKFLALALVFLPALIDDIFHIKTYNPVSIFLVFYILWLGALKLHENGFLVFLLLFLSVSTGLLTLVALVLVAPANPVPLNPAVSIFLGFVLFYAVIPGAGFLFEIFIFRSFEKRKSEKLRLLRENTQATIKKNSAEIKAAFEERPRSVGLPRL